MKLKLLTLIISAVLILAACSAPENNSSADENSSTDYTDNSSSKSEVSSENSSIESTESHINTTDTEYVVGDIVLIGGSVVKADNLGESDNPAAVIAGKNAEGTFFAVGIYRSDNPLQWSDGENSPAFDFVKNYADAHSFDGGFTDWRMPDISELQIIYDNRESINKSLEIIHKSNPAAMDSLSTTWYWSSSRSESQVDYAWFVHFYNGYAGECPQNFTNVNVIAVYKL
ncbi:MAG: DUF1566 domain-containing protein [Ruminococcaceae bacterium]|nr:DUF1566 domain-containing protein [Oscillospiraceae bacterium]